MAEQGGSEGDGAEPEMIIYGKVPPPDVTETRPYIGGWIFGGMDGRRHAEGQIGAAGGG